MKPPEALQKAIADHASVPEFLRNLNHTVAIWNQKEVAARIALIHSFLKTHVVDHFAMENATVFPELLANFPNPNASRLVAILETDHVALLREIDKLNDILAQAERAADAPAMAQLDMAFRMFVGKLQRHAAEEDKLFAMLTAKLGNQPASQ